MPPLAYLGLFCYTAILAEERCIVKHMPELPDLVIYREAIKHHCAGCALEKIRLKSPFLLRTVAPPLATIFGKTLISVTRIGKRLVFGFDDDFFLLIHLMIAGRLGWRKKGAGIPGKIGLAALDFSSGTLLLTEASTKKRASLHLVQGPESPYRFDRGGIEIFEADLASFRNVLLCENHTLKRALTDPRLFSGIGNSYSDEIIHAAQLSPLKRTAQLKSNEVSNLFEACRNVLAEWTERLRAEAGSGFPSKVTAFREGMAVHGRYGLACPVCRGTVQRIVYSENECNYCPGCQTGGKILADRSLSRILKGDWPRNMDELDDMMNRHRSVPGEKNET